MHINRGRVASNKHVNACAKLIRSFSTQERLKWLTEKCMTCELEMVGMLKCKKGEL